MCKIQWTTSPDTMDSSYLKTGIKRGLHLYLACFQGLCLQMYTQFAIDVRKTRLQHRAIVARGLLKERYIREKCLNALN